MSSSSGIRSRSILLVEADRRTSQRLAGLLQEDGFQVEALYDGASAMARLGKEPLPDTIITELTLPNIDGTSVARFALANDSRIRIIVLTRHPHLARLPIYGVHSSTVLTKPLDYARLLQLLSGAPANDVRHDHALRPGA